MCILYISYYIIINIIYFIWFVIWNWNYFSWWKNWYWSYIFIIKFNWFNQFYFIIFFIIYSILGEFIKVVKRINFKLFLFSSILILLCSIKDDMNSRNELIKFLSINNFFKSSKLKCDWYKFEFFWIKISIEFKVDINLILYWLNIFVIILWWLMLNFLPFNLK